MFFKILKNFILCKGSYSLTFLLLFFFWRFIVNIFNTQCLYLKTGNRLVTESSLYNAFFYYFAFYKAKQLKEDKTNKSDSYVIFTVFTLIVRNSESKISKLILFFSRFALTFILR